MVSGVRRMTSTRSIYSEKISQNHRRISFREPTHGISEKFQERQSKLFFISN